MLHYLSGITSYNALLGNIMAGNSWEGFVISQIAVVLKFSKLFGQDIIQYQLRSHTDHNIMNLLLPAFVSWSLNSYPLLSDSIPTCRFPLFLLRPQGLNRVPQCGL